MKYPVCRIAVYLICHALLCAANTAAQQNKQSAGAIGGWEAGGHKSACTEKNPAPDCMPVPHVVSSPQPTYSEEARKAKIEGSVILSLIVDERGNPTNLRVISGLGMGLNERAIEAVRGWKFEPAFGKDGKPVAAKIAVEVDFHL
jgi:periplasmic protein TonB